jgi:hypothetical protein
MLVAVNLTEAVKNVFITNDYFEGLVYYVKRKKTGTCVFQTKSHHVLPEQLPRLHFLGNPSVSCKEHHDDAQTMLSEVEKWNKDQLWRRGAGSQNRRVG